jgi:hypothetical protein
VKLERFSPAKVVKNNELLLKKTNILTSFPKAQRAENGTFEK